MKKELTLQVNITYNSLEISAEDLRNEIDSAIDEIYEDDPHVTVESVDEIEPDRKEDSPSQP